MPLQLPLSLASVEFLLALALMLTLTVNSNVPLTDSFFGHVDFLPSS